MQAGRSLFSLSLRRPLPFSEGLAAVAVINKTLPEDEGHLKFTRQWLRWGYINETGMFVILPKFADAKEFSEGLAAVEVKSPAVIFGDWASSIERERIRGGVQ
jgi:hypothetical protein